MSTELLTALLASGVIASLVTSLFSLFNLKQTNKKLVDIEKLKNENTIQTFRYTKLYEVNNELNTLPDIDYNYIELKDGRPAQSKELFKKVVAETTSRFLLIEKIFNKAHPLFSDKNSETVHRLFEKEKQESNSLVKALYTGGETDISALLDIRQKTEKQFKEAISKQLAELMNSMK